MKADYRPMSMLDVSGTSDDIHDLLGQRTDVHVIHLKLQVLLINQE